VLRRALAIAVVLASLAAEAEAADVVVMVERVPNSKGEVHVDLCTEDTFLTPNCPYDGVETSRRGRVIVTLHNIPPGRYAATAYHDENANQDLDLNVLGMPKEAYGFSNAKEAYGFSNDPPMLMGPPLFKDSAFDVGDKDVEVKVRLKR
jgi:uncharacterized protein (DUF2141 family)